MEKIFTEQAPSAIGPYSQAIKVNGVVYTSGQIAILNQIRFRDKQNKLCRICNMF